ncbi:ribosomal protein S18 acetylase RimI-like enzyme [Nakamurella sp. UYEF19]|uniref:GNAT family N-acetyltransferase n=1 Tax=Nakamurella sp. UYEF19 TaxID=1756392 RepID=UPI003396811F
MPAQADLAAAERYLDLAPRTGAIAREVGPFTLFVSNGPWPYYARPRLGSDAPITSSALLELRTACATADVPLAIEWVDTLRPSFAAVATDAGLTVVFRPLLVLDHAHFIRPSASRTRILAPDDKLLPTARAVADLGFASPGTDIGVAGPSERDALAGSFPAEVLQHMQDRAAAGLTVTAAAFDHGGGDQGIVAVGMHQPLGDTSEIVGVATLPSIRRRGWAAAIAGALVEHAFSVGVTRVMLTADSDDVARIYRRLGFRQVGRCCEAAPPES